MAPRRRRSSSRGRSPGPVQREHALPVEAANDLLPGFRGKLHTVKTQELNLEDGSVIVIARVKVPVPKGVSGHLIKRFDTGAISASSLFRAAYPKASAEVELAEMSYIAKRCDTKRAGDEDAEGAGKLTGTWVPVEDAEQLAKEYNLLKFASELFEFEQTPGEAHGAVSSPAAPTPRKMSKSPAPPSSASSRSKRARHTSPPAQAPAPAVPASAPADAPAASTRSATSASQSLAPPTPSKPASRRKSTKPASSSAATETASTDAQSTTDEPTGGIQVTQETIVDEATGEVVEKTEVTLTGSELPPNGLMGSDEQARQAVEEARKLIDSLKEDGVLSSSTSKKRSRPLTDAEEEEDLQAEEAKFEQEESQKQGFVGRFFGRKRGAAAQRANKSRGADIGQLQLMQSLDGAQVLVAQAPAPQPTAARRRYIAMAGMVVMGAATAAAPYFFG